MNRQPIALTKNLQITSDQEKKMLDALHEQLSNSLIDENIAALQGVWFAHERTDFFGDTSQSAATDASKVSAKQSVSHRVFVRDTPVRNAQLKTSVPSWATGAAVDKTIGPFINKDGRKLWYDFYSIEELIALYVQGNPNPVLLFHISTFRRFFENIPFVNELMSSYQLIGDSIWINSQTLAADAPAGYYTGLRIKGGEINLSEIPQNINNQLTVSAGATITVRLQLNQPGPVNADPTSDYGKDARAASLTLPQQFNFSFTGSNVASVQLASGAAWTLYGSQDSFTWDAEEVITFDPLLNEILVPFISAEQNFSIQNNLSAFNLLAGSANIQWSAWSLPVAHIDITNPVTAEGIGALTIRCNAGLSSRWAGVQNGTVSLSNPYIQLHVGKISLLELAAINLFGTQEFLLWEDSLNPHRSSIELFYNTAFPFMFLSEAAGSEMIVAQANTIANIDRPVTVDAHPLDIKTKHSLLFISATKTFRFLYLYDDNILADNAGYGFAFFPQPISFALHNAVFKTTKTKGLSLFGDLAENFINVEKGDLLLTFGIYAYLPILPDPYAVNLGVLKEQFTDYSRIGSVGNAYSSQYNQYVWMLLICSIKWVKQTAKIDNVNVSFLFAPLPQQAQSYSAVAFDRKAGNDSISSQTLIQPNSFIKNFEVEQANNIATTAPASENISGTIHTEMSIQGLPDYQGIWNNRFGYFESDMFALLDVSSHANQVGVSVRSFNYYRGGNMAGNEQLEMYKTYNVASTSSQNDFPFQILGMNVITRNLNVNAFMLPQISWEPVNNLTPPQKLGDPPILFNYYPNDGGATRIFNNSVQFVPIAPIPVTNHLVKSYHDEQNNKLAAMFTLPFGLRAFAGLEKTKPGQSQKPAIHENRPSFGNKIVGGIQLKLTGGSVDANPNVSNQFEGVALQINNVLDIFGSPTKASTLGYDVTEIFNGEFFNKAGGVPLKRFDLSGYGASIFSNWLDKGAEFALTSQAEFEVFVGRTAHEVIQVKSVLYPWGIHVVRTITLFRTGSGYEYRVDSGWKAESDGHFDFTFTPKKAYGSPDNLPKVNPYNIHPGTIKGLYNIKNITDATGVVAPYKIKAGMDINNFYDFDAFDKTIYPYNGGSKLVDIDLETVYFDADIDIENTVQGQVNGLVPAKQILGFVQVAPTGIPLTPTAFAQLLLYQNGSIGGPVDCIIDIGLNGQQMRVSRVDVNYSVDASNTNPVFTAAARGNTILPNDGSWSMVTHIAKTGDVIPLPDGVTVPLIRIGEMDVNLNFPTDGLLRIANPTELLRLPTTDTINYGFLQSTNTQKALFLTPAYQKLTDPTITGTVMSKTPPLFADAYRLMNAKGIFPNVGDAVSNYGDAIALAQNFVLNAATDGGTQLLELMQINQKDATGNLLAEGYKLLKQAENFDLSSLLDLSKPWYLVNTSFLKIYIEYQADVRNGNAIPTNPDGSPDYHNPANFNDVTGLLNYDVDSFASNTADNWVSKLNNIAMVVDLGPLTRLVTIKGNFNAQNGSEAAYQGDDSDPDFPTPQVEFSEVLDVVMDILQILIVMQGGDYAAALKQGLKIAMSNDADSWSYKFDASQEIPLVKFPVPDIVYDDPNTPLKLQASMKLGVYFSETFKITTDPSQLLPSAGAFVEFFGQLSVMCVSLSVATVYAVGSVDLTIAADTVKGPSMDMKFGFGAQIVVGLPVVGNVSLLYMVGVEIYYDSTTLTLTASLLFQGHADLLGGLVEITITIEAQGSVSRTNGQTTCEAQVTFAIDISIFLVIDIDFSKTWSEQRQIA
jgi:hypothetical protein